MTIDGDRVAEQLAHTQQIIKSSKDYEKIILVAKKPFLLLGRPVLFPDHVPRDKKEYVYVNEWEWTSGFFPGSVWLVYERLTRLLPASIDSVTHNELLKLCRLWQSGVENQKFSSAHHDIGFVIMPSFSKDFELTGSKAAMQTILRAATTLASRWNDSAQVICSWDSAYTVNRSFPPNEGHCLVIIDSLMNLELLYVAAQASKNQFLAEIATKHARKLVSSHFRQNGSTYHLVNFDASSGKVKDQITHQGFSDSSTWSRGQSWAIYGFASVYKYTRLPIFLEASKRAAKYFLENVVDGYVYWDFDAPRPCPYDTAAAMIACSGMLLLDELEYHSHYLPQILKIYETTVKNLKCSGESILDHATTNNNPLCRPHERKADHGLCYADYYLLEVENKLIRMNAKAL